MADAPDRAVEVVAEALRGWTIGPPLECEIVGHDDAREMAAAVVAALRAAVDPGDVDQLAEVARRYAAKLDRVSPEYVGTMLISAPDLRLVLAHLAPRLTGAGREGVECTDCGHLWARHAADSIDVPSRDALHARGCQWPSCRCTEGWRDHLAAGPVPVAGGDEAHVPAADGVECWAETDDAEGHWTCTRPAGHAGDHAAIGDDGVVMARWPQEVTPVSGGDEAVDWLAVSRIIDVLYEMGVGGDVPAQARSAYRRDIATAVYRAARK